MAFPDQLKIHRLTHVGNIDNGFVNAIMQTVISLPPDCRVLDIHISSNGGDTRAGITAYNYLKSIPLVVMTRNIGHVDSAAILPFLAGEIRTAESVSRFTFHPAALPGGEYLNYVQLDEKMRLLNNDIDEYATIVSNEAPSFGSKNDVINILRSKTIILDNADEYYKTGILTPPDKQIAVLSL